MGLSPAPGKQSGGVKYLHCTLHWSNLGAATTATRLPLTLLSCDVYQRKWGGGGGGTPLNEARFNGFWPRAAARVK